MPAADTAGAAALRSSGSEHGRFLEPSYFSGMCYALGRQSGVDGGRQSELSLRIGVEDDSRLSGSLTVRQSDRRQVRTGKRTGQGCQVPNRQP